MHVGNSKGLTTTYLNSDFKWYFLRFLFYKSVLILKNLHSKCYVWFHWRYVYIFDKKCGRNLYEFVLQKMHGKKNNVDYNIITIK